MATDSIPITFTASIADGDTSGETYTEQIPNGELWYVDRADMVVDRNGDGASLRTDFEIQLQNENTGRWNTVHQDVLSVSVTEGSDSGSLDAYFAGDSPFRVRINSIATSDSADGGDVTNVLQIRRIL